jgi:hypothetical protein
LPSSPSGDREPVFQFLPEVLAETRGLPAEVRRALAQVVVDLHANPHLGEPMDDRPPKVLQGCRKLRFDVPAHRGKPGYRLVYRNEPSDGAVGVMVVLAVGERRNMTAYANAAARATRRAAGDRVRRR